MAYYPTEFVERIQLVKRLQEERFMPLRVIRELIAEDPGAAARLIELEDRIVERAVGEPGRGDVAQGGARDLRHAADRARQARGDRRSDAQPPRLRPDDVKIIEAISRFRAGGYEEALGFTVYDTLRYREALAPLVQEEVARCSTASAGEVEVERALEIVAAGGEPLRDLIGAMHSKMLLAELRRQRDATG